MRKRNFQEFNATKNMVIKGFIFRKILHLISLLALSEMH